MTKTLTSAAVLQADEAGDVDLDAAVTKYVPNFHMNSSPQRASAIKVRHLLTHTSGLEDTGIALDAPANEQADSGLEAFATGRFADLDTIAATPGVVYNYANANFMLAGLVAEKATATPYRLLMRDRLFAPLDMRRTFFLAEDVISDGDYAVGQNCVSAEDITCDPDLPEVIQPDTYDNPAARPAGYAWSSVLDLAKFTNLLVYGDPTVLSDDLRTQMVSPQVSMRSLGDVSSYGFGTVVDSGIFVNNDYEPVRLVTHNGALAGYRSVFYCLPALEFCFIALANGASNDWTKSFITALETLTILPAPAIFPDVSPQPSRFTAYAGTYRQGEFDDYEFTASDGNLYVKIPSFDAVGTAYDHLLQPTTVDNFVLHVGTDTLPLTFFADASGRYQYVVSQPYIAERVAR